MTRPAGAGRLRAALAGCAVLVLSMVGLVVTAPSAAAHDVLESTSPADRAAVDRVPATVVLTFDQPALAMGTQVVVRGPDGEVSAGSPKLIDNTVRQAIGAGSPAGTYTVEWRVTSADGHPVSGQFGFIARAAGGSGQPRSTQAPAAPATQGSALPLVLGTVVVLVVVAVPVLVVWRRRRRTPTP